MTFYRRLSQVFGYSGTIFNRPPSGTLLLRRLQAGLQRWKDAFKIIRRNCETDWAQVYPQYAVSTWIGHGIEVSARYYLQVPKELYDKVAATKSKNKTSMKKRSKHKISS